VSAPSESPVLAGLNPQQREAVLASEGPVLILAGAGSGKTRVITSRIAHLVLERGVPSRAILAVTFTNKAAAEMKARVAALLHGVALEAWVSTFHSFCVRLLRREAAAAGLPPGFAIWDEADQLAAVSQALRTLDVSEKLHAPRRVLSRISAAKNAASGDGADDDALLGLYGQVAGEYARILSAAGALDFDDLLLRAVQLLASSDAVRDAYRRRFRYLLVDEYQDTNRPQYELVRLLAGDGGNVTVVGDEDQSIYSWRGADIRNILDFERDFPGARVLRLEQNYRSSQPILDAAGGLVGHNLQRKGKTLRAVRDGGEMVRVRRTSDEFEEAAYVVDGIARERASGRVAVLYRMNAQSRLLEEALLRARVPYTVVGGVGFYERREVKDLLAYLRLVRNPDDGMALRRVLNVPPRGIGERTLRELETLASGSGASLWSALADTLAEARLPPRALNPLRAFRDLVDGLRDDAQRLGIRALLERALERSGYAAALADQDSRESQERLENLAELLSAAAEFEAREPAAGLADFLDRVALLTDQDIASNDAPVVLMTLHSAKGLEFDAVWLVGLEEGLLPHARSLGAPAALEEERRLCYVGMTRARRLLCLSHARTRQLFGQRRLAQPSRFLSEIPRDSLAPGAEVGHAEDAPVARPVWAPVSVPAPPPAGPWRPGARVRHPLFGLGTVLRAEGHGDDQKLTVSFAAGAKRLVARYAGLEPA
jgi:DNA helicase II / ATP-dependent DNA helicase PcrA